MSNKTNLTEKYLPSPKWTCIQEEIRSSRLDDSHSSFQADEKKTDAAAASLMTHLTPSALYTQAQFPHLVVSTILHPVPSLHEHGQVHPQPLLGIRVTAMGIESSSVEPLD